MPRLQRWLTLLIPLVTNRTGRYSFFMATSEEIFRDAMALPPEARAELTERLVESLAQDISPEITSEQLAEVRRRIAQVESGEVELIPGDEALARVRNLLAPHLPSS
jgi:putative addiction module component (TIGR02574 family)